VPTAVQDLILPLIFLENIRRLIISKNDEWVITCSDDRSVKVWDVEERCNTYSYENCHQGGIYGLTITADNRYIISGGADGSVKVWNSDIATQKMDRIDVAHSKNKYHLSDIS
jgi:WD40 repeat protein